MSESYVKERLGVVPSPWDNQRYRVRSPTVPELVSLPEEFDGLLPYHDLIDWYDQGSVGSCVGWTGSIIMEVTGHLMDRLPEDLSAGWLYQKSREQANILPWQEGSTVLGLMKALQKVGATTEECCKTVTKQPFSIAPCGNAKAIAKSYQITSYWQINSLVGDIKAAVYGLTHPAPYTMPDGSSGKIPVGLAIPVYESIAGSVNGDGVIPMPQPGETLLGGHAITCRGWKRIGGVEHLVLSNSWAKTGDHGTYYLPTGYPVWEAWLIHNGPYTPPPQPTPYEPSSCPVARVYVWPYNTLNALVGGKTRLRPVV